MSILRSVPLVAAMVAVCMLAGATRANEAAKDYTAREANAEELAVFRREYVAAYKEHGKHGAWDDAAAKFLDDWAVYQTYHDVAPTYRIANVPKLSELVRQGRAVVVDARCDDPLVMSCYGIALGDAAEVETALPTLVKAAKAMAASGYPDSTVWRTAYRTLWLDRTSANQATAKVCAERALKLANIPSPSRGERLRAFVNVRTHLASLASNSERVDFMAKLRETDGADAWVVDTADGRLHIDLAWDSRGDGWADTVTEKGWRGFYKHLSIARECLTRAWQLAPDIPKAADEMITVAMGAGSEFDENVGTWFDRAIDVQLDHAGAYSAMLYALRPRWGGSHTAMLEVGRRGVQTNRYDTDAPWQFVEAVLRIGRDVTSNDDERWQNLKDQAVYDETVAVVDAYDQIAGKSGNRWYRTFRAGLAWRAERFVEAKQILDELGDAADLDALKRFSTDPRQVAAAKLLLMAGPELDAVRKAETLMKERTFAEAVDVLTEAQAALEKAAADDPAAKAELARTKPFFDRRLTLLRRRAALRTGEWVDVQPDTMFTSWSRLSGVWKVGEDGTLSGRYGTRFTPTMRLSERLSRSFEFAGRAGHGKGLGRPSVYLRSKAGGRAWISFYEQAVVLQIPEAKVNERIMRDRTEIADFLVRVEHGKLNVLVNGKPVIRDYELPKRLSENVTPGVAMALHPAGTATFTKLRARALEPITYGDEDAPAGEDKQGLPADPNAPPEGL